MKKLLLYVINIIEGRGVSEKRGTLQSDNSFTIMFEKSMKNFFTIPSNGPIGPYIILNGNLKRGASKVIN